MQGNRQQPIRPTAESPNWIETAASVTDPVIAVRVALLNGGFSPESTERMCEVLFAKIIGALKT